MLTLPHFALQSRQGNQLTLASPQGHVAHIFVLEEDIVRVMVLPHGSPRHPRTWAIAPGAEDLPDEGRDRFDLNGFSLPDFTLAESSDHLELATARISLRIALTGLSCQWSVLKDGRWYIAAEDRPTQSYNFGGWDDRVYHYLKRSADEIYYGLGERAGEANRHGHSYRLCNLDAMGYSARSTDPLYKHIPFYLTYQPSTRVAFGLFYDTLSDCTFDMGREMNNYHGHYRYFVADFGDLDIYFIAGDTMPEITRRQTWLTGRPAFTPRWSLGYSGSTMAYTDAPDAQTRMDDFLKDCREHDIPCDSFHLSSGYTSIDGRRYVFNWNRKKFPDPKGFVQKYLDHGVKLCPNIKPCLLHDHPRFEEARAAGLFIHQPDGSPDTVQFWDEAGALLDFTNPATRQWWRARVKDSLLDYGIAATWNDNNEFEVLSRTALAHGVDAPFPAREAKPLHTLLMLKSSRRAQQEHAPHERPYLVSRAGAAGMQRYVQTWSGDNYTSWETLRYNIKMALGLAMSGVSNTGHDIGGFSGPRPSPELFLRWVQHGIFLPRFSIHSWNDDGTANEPWMYPAITHHIRDLIQLRYRLLPYLYDLLWRSHSDYVPIIQPTHYAFPDDARCFDDNDDMLLGDRLLVASVVEEGASMRRVYLPAGTGWYDWWLGDYYDGGQDIELSAPWNHPPLLVREGAIVPLNIAEQHFGQAADERAFAIFPTRGIGRQVEVCFEDDGQSQAYRQGQHGAWQVTVGTDSERVTVEVVATGTCPPVQRELTLLLPPQEARRIDLQAGRYLSDRIEREWRCVRIAFD